MPSAQLDWRATPEKLEAIVRRLAEVARPSRILLFGSAGRGELGPDSDFDLLVIMPETVADWRKESVRFGHAVVDFHVPTDILVISEQEAAAALKNRYGVLGLALREGKLLYEAPR
ncbi:MAG: nucleotidyltransferase domain-containing protein [Terriglobales bacterium]